MCDLVAELLVERGDLREALDWATAGVELCLQREAAGQDSPGHDAAGPGDAPVRAVPARATASPADDDPGELRLLLSLRYRIRNDLGLAEDDYDRLLDEAPPAAGTGTAGSRDVRVISESDA
jgi:hypothetical protein